LKVVVHILRVKRDRRATNLPLHALFSSNPSDANFGSVIFLNIVQRSDNKNSGVQTTPQVPEGRHCKLCPGTVCGSHERDARINFTEGSFGWKLKVVVHFLRKKKIGGQLAPPALHAFEFIG
jgi:hypothetical protein